MNVSGVTAWARSLDLPLLAGILALCGVSMALVYSASGQDPVLLARQGTRIGVALLVMLVMARVPPRVLHRWSPWVYGAGLALLALVLLAGITGKGAQRWLELGQLRFQPAEVMKIALPMMVAWMLSQRPLPPHAWQLLLTLLVVFVPAWLVIEQPDLGTAILIALSGVTVVFLAGIRWRWILLLLAVVTAAAPMLWWFVLLDYQKQRIVTAFDPWADPLGTGYHIIQSIIAIGSGGLLGKGWLNGSQSQLEFIPERSTDFIFAVLAEEFGLLGVLGFFALSFFVVLRGLWIAFIARDTYSRLLAGCFSLTVFFYFFVNVGMVSGILPVVGMPLPLVSFGGSSMVTLMLGFGIIMSIQAHRDLLRQK